MKKRFIPTIIAMVILVILAIYSNKYEVDDVLKNGEVPSISILNTNENNIKYISFGKDGKYDLKVELSGSNSKIIEPQVFNGDNAEVFGVARHFSELQSEFYFTENATDSASFGFTPNSPMVKFQTSTETIELTLGSKVPVGSSYYLKKTGDTNIYIVPSHITGSFEKTLTDLRNRALFKEDFGKCNEIQYNCGTESFKLVLDYKNSEWLIADTKYSADSVEAANIINNMRNLRVSNFEDGDFNSDKYGFASPSLKIKILNEENKTYELLAGLTENSDTFVSSDNKVVQKVSKSKLKELMLTLNDVRDKFLDIYPIKEITEIEVADATGTLIIKKENNKWVYDNIVVKEEDVKDFINSLNRTKVTEYALKQNLDVLGLDNVEKCSKIQIKSNDKIKTYWLGDVKGSSLFMMDENEMIQISAELSDAFKRFIYRARSSDVKIK